MVNGVVITAEWLRSIGPDDLASLAVLRRIELEGVPLVLDEGSIVDRYEDSLEPDSPGRRFMSAQLISGNVKYVRVEMSTEHLSISDGARPFILASLADNGIVVLADEALLSSKTTLPQSLQSRVVGEADIHRLLSSSSEAAAAHGPVAVILTALAVEFESVLAHVVDVRENVHPRGTVYKVGTFASGHDMWRVAVAIIGQHNERAAFETERALAHFDPAVVIFAGIAGGLKDVKLGDVVAASSIFYYDAGKSTETFLPRPQVANSAYPLIQRARVEAAERSWCERIKPAAPEPCPTAIVAPVAAGSQVIASTSSDAYRQLREGYSELVAVEMEGFGFLAAAEANRAHSVVIRGISDLIDDKSGSDESQRQAAAAAHASAFAFQLLARYTATGATAH
jgi:nucleoside phosphorylase